MLNMDLAYDLWVELKTYVPREMKTQEKWKHMLH
jgi:hypothetical protein